MASRWDDLDAATALEQGIAASFASALTQRGYDVVHNGTSTRHAPGGRADIEARCQNGSLLMLIEVTKRTGSAAENEFVSTTDHLDRAIEAGGFELFGVLFVAPAIGGRLRKNFLQFNRERERAGRPGRVFMLDFAGLDTILTEMARRDPELYPGSRWAALFETESWSRATDDHLARQIAVERLLTECDELREELSAETLEEHARVEQELKKRVQVIEDRLRSAGVTGDNANRTLIYLTFMRLFEEKRIREGKPGPPNRMTASGFKQWVADQNAALKIQHADRFINYLLSVMRHEDPAVTEAGLLAGADGGEVKFHPNVTDGLILDVVFSVLDEYDFLGSQLDILGVVFEALARRAEKDTRVGQFFTPTEVVDFCASIAGLDARDRVLDPAVGTARFLIAAMKRMLVDAQDRGYEPNEVASIKQRQLFGVDLDDWVAAIAKMNMYIHGDGKSNVVAGNGLVLADTRVLAVWPKGIGEQIDVVLTNPPLGDVDLGFAAAEWSRLAEAPPASASSFLERLRVVPMVSKEEQALTRAEAGLSAAERSLQVAVERGDQIAVSRARSRWRRAQRRLTELQADIARGSVALSPRVRAMKGGAVFAGAILNYLKPESAHRSALPFEWRGGRMVIVLDEAILNTPAQEAVRRFLTHHFFIKAVVSLDRSAFQYLARTDAKTSVVFAIRKPDPCVVQQEPIFFAHAARVGYSATGEWIGSDLPDILDAYENVRHAIQGSYRGATFLRAQATERIERLHPGNNHEWFIRWPVSDGGRLDYFAARSARLADALRTRPGGWCTLGDILVRRMSDSPPASRTGEYDFATIERTTARVLRRGRARTKYRASDLWLVREGDIVVSGIDLVHGAIGIAGADVDSCVLSKEMYAFRVRDGADVDPRYMVLLLRTPQCQVMLEGLVSGTSNRTRLSPDELLSIPVPKPPPRDQQMCSVELLRRAEDLREGARRSFVEAESALVDVWP